MRRAYVPRKFSASSMDLINISNDICAEYQAAGYDLTLRQLYYQFVSRGLIANKDSEYKRLGSVVNDARLAGLIDWDYIVDRTRFIRSLSHWDSPADVLNSAAASYRADMWADQKYRPEVWIEKDALVGVIERVCNRWDVPYFSCRGYTSQSEMWGAAQRIGGHLKEGKTPVILHFGEFPSDDLAAFGSGRGMPVAGDIIEIGRVQDEVPSRLHLFASILHAYKGRGHEQSDGHKGREEPRRTADVPVRDEARLSGQWG